MLTIKKEMAEIYKKDNQGMHNKILVGSAGSGKTTRLIQYMQYLHSVNAPFCYISSVGDVSKEFPNTVKFYHVKTQLYSTFNIDPIVYLKENISPIVSNEVLTAIQAIISHVSTESVQIELEMLKLGISEVNTFIELCDKLHIHMKADIECFFKGMTYLPSVSNKKELLFEISQFIMWKHAEYVHNMLSSVINSLILINQIDHVIIDEIRPEQYLHIKQACELVPFLTITVQSLHTLEIICQNTQSAFSIKDISLCHKKMHLALFRTMSMDDMQYPEFDSIRKRWQELTPGAYFLYINN